MEKETKNCSHLPETLYTCMLIFNLMRNTSLVRDAKRTVKLNLLFGIIKKKVEEVEKEMEEHKKRRGKNWKFFSNRSKNIISGISIHNEFNFYGS